MSEFDPASLPSKSDDELAELELDKSLPIDAWMAVEKERGKREERRRREAERSRITPAAPGATAARPTAATEAHEDERIQDALAQLRALLVPGETMGAYAVQRRLFALVRRRIVVCATSGRFISLTRGLFGGYTPHDVRWQDLDDATVSAGIFGATLSITSLASDDLASRGRTGSRVLIEGLRKEQAQQVYTLCQAQEQAWREKRRVRDLDELRAQSGGVQIGGAFPGSAASSLPSGGDPTDRLRRAKQMLDDGLITDTEYESIKARVVDGL
ncbi:MAG: PH domain-containing protein [bacterium]